MDFHKLAVRFIKTGQFPNTLNNRVSAEAFWAEVRKLERKGAV